MPQQFNAIEEGGLNQILVNRLGMQVTSPAPGVAPEIFPTLVLENDRPEWTWLANEKRLLASRLCAAEVALFSEVRFRHPADTSMIVVVEKVQLTSTAQVEVRRMATALVDLVNVPGNGYPSDFRAPFNTAAISSVCSLSSDGVAAGPAGSEVGWILPPGITVYDTPFILPPNTGLSFTCVSVNISVLLNIQWRERRAIGRELVG